MYSRQVTVINATGIHARPASQFVKQAQKFRAKVEVKNLKSSADGRMNAKSILGVLTLGMRQGHVIEIWADGEDEKMAVDSLAALVEEGFGEA